LNFNSTILKPSERYRERAFKLLNCVKIDNNFKIN
jgi:hypothetical protein